MNTPKTYIFFGNVGAGKGTQIELLKNLIGESDSRKIVYVAPGITFRALTGSDNYTGSIIKSSLERGQLQPDFITISICTWTLIQEMTADCHLFIDAYPRTVIQAQAVVSTLEYYGRKNVELVYIEVSKEEVAKRMKLRGRSDDTDEGINRRFWEYENNVIPAMNLLKDKGYTLHTINGEQSVESVHEDIKKALIL